MIRCVQVVAEGALKHGIPCVEKFDQMFRSGCQSLSELDFGSVDISLYLQEYLGRGRCKECQWCAGGDHKDWECAAQRSLGPSPYGQAWRDGHGGRGESGLARWNAASLGMTGHASDSSVVLPTCVRHVVRTTGRCPVGRRHTQQ